MIVGNLVFDRNKLQFLELSTDIQGFDFNVDGVVYKVIITIDNVNYYTYLIVSSSTSKNDILRKINSGESIYNVDWD
jgi:hypothetical protein